MNSYDAVVIGGGHNGLVAAAYLARGGAKTIVLEARDNVGGASTTEQPWGPEFNVSALSYVVSLIPPRLVNELKLQQFGYKVYPQESYFMPRVDGDALVMGGKDPAAKRAEIARYSKHDADALDKWNEWIGALGAMLAPMLVQPAPAVGSKRPADLLSTARVGWRFRKLGIRGVADLTRLMTMSISDLLDDWFESPQVKAMLAVSGVIGTWAGPAEPGTAYVMLHHHIGDLGDGQVGQWGFARGGMGAVANAIASSARSFGAEIRTGSPVTKILTRNGRATGVALDSGEEIHADTVVTATHPKIAFLQQLDRSELPNDFVTDIERWKSRSGVVKINLGLAELPEFTSAPGAAPHIQGGTIAFAQDVEHIETAFQDARSGRAAELPFADMCIPSYFDSSLAPEGKHVMSMFTQWVPHTWADNPDQSALDAYADRMIDAVSELSPNLKGSILHRQVIGPHEMQESYGLIGGNIFHGELSPEQLFHLRPAPGYADYRTPIKNLYQASSATHGGGGVTGIPGLNVVDQIRRDRRLGKLKRR
jgi:phytoene dehydrogenase-like protein